jgi:hypothetical protein
MHPLAGKKQTPEHIARRLAAMPKTRKPGGGRPANTPETIWKKVDKRGPDECWPWIGWRNEGGYGRTEINDVAYYAHRVVYDLENPGIITLKAPKNGKHGLVLHKCDNPCCCNPNHLYIGDQKQNVKDAIDRNRRWRNGAKVGGISRR